MRTGAYKWHHQSVRHDIFDMDNVHSPVLADVNVGGQTRKAIYYGSKAHMTFILDRTTGQPLTSHGTFSRRWAGRGSCYWPSTMIRAS